MRYWDSDCYWWFEKKWAVYEPGCFYDYFVCYCYGEYEARDWEWDGYVVYEPYSRYL